MYDKNTEKYNYFDVNLCETLFYVKVDYFIKIKIA